MIVVVHRHPPQLTCRGSASCNDDNDHSTTALNVEDNGDDDNECFSSNVLAPTKTRTDDDDNDDDDL